MSVDAASMQPTKRRFNFNELWQKEDWWAVWFAFVLFAGTLVGFIESVPTVASWTANPLAAVPLEAFPSKLLLLAGLGGLTAIGIWVMRANALQYLAGFTAIFGLGVVASALGSQTTMKSWGLGYALWALAIGLLIANTVGTPKWLLAGAKSELIIKTGLVLLGGEILFSQILRLGAPGLLVAWVVTPIVIISMFWFAMRFLKMKSKPLAMVIASATSVCGVSAAIAVAGATRAKREELTLAVGMTMIFTVAMMVGMPIIAKAAGLPVEVGGAWLGGTVDSTGAVVAAGALLGPEAEKVAALVKMIQNVLIGVVAFAVALYWVTRIERDPSGSRLGIGEIWYRFPKFVIGFAAASVLFSFVFYPLMGEQQVSLVLDETKTLRGWLFCLAFVAIGLESNFRDLAKQLVGGKPIILYLTGQTLNVLLTLLMAFLAFGGLLFALN